MRCRQCGAMIEPSGQFCGDCGASVPPRPQRYAAAAKSYEALRALLEAGRLTREAYLAELQKLILQDAAGSFWMLGAETGDWYWHDGRRWVRRDPPAIDPPAAPPAPQAAKGPVVQARSSGLPLLWLAAAFLIVVLTGGFVLGSLAVASLIASASGPVATSQMAAAIPTASRPTSSPLTTPAPAPSATSAPTPTPTPESAFTVRPFDPDRDQAAEGVLGRIEWEYQSAPGKYVYEITFAVEWSPLLGFAWCAADETILEQNWSHIQMGMTLDGYALDEGRFLLEDQLGEGIACRAYKAIIQGWQPGLHTLVWTQSFDEAVNDGQSTFPAGDYITEIRINVMEDMIFEDEFADSSGGWSEEDNEEHWMWIEADRYHILMRQGPSYSLSLYHARTYTDVFVSTTARIIGPGAFGIILGFSDADNFVLAELTQAGECRVKERAGGNWNTLVEWGPLSDFQQGQPNRLSVSLEKGEVRVVVNSKYVGDVPVDSGAEGSVGLAVGSEGVVRNLQGDFDEFYVEALK